MSAKAKSDEPKSVLLRFGKENNFVSWKNFQIDACTREFVFKQTSWKTESPIFQEPLWLQTLSIRLFNYSFLFFSSILHYYHFSFLVIYLFDSLPYFNQNCIFPLPPSPFPSPISISLPQHFFVFSLTSSSHIRSIHLYLPFYRCLSSFCRCAVIHALCYDIPPCIDIRQTTWSMYGEVHIWIKLESNQNQIKIRLE